MADFKVQRGQTTIASGSASKTLTAGTDYTAPSADSAAFLRITNVHKTANGVTDTQGEGNDEWGISVSGSITTSQTFTRYSATTATGNDIHIEWEIIEYVGPSSGGNEFIVRHTEEVAVGSSTEVQDSSAVSGVSDSSDVVVFITGQRKDHSLPGQVHNLLFTAEYDSVNDVATLTRMVGSPAGFAASVSIAVVEFTGTNWGVQRATHTYSASGVTETETITAVGSAAKAFIHAQLRTDLANLDESGQRVWLSATDTLSFQLQSGANVDHIAVVWVVENTQSGGATDMSVQRVSGSRGTGGTGTVDTWTETITAVSALAESSIMGEGSTCTGTGFSNDRNAVGLRLTATDTVTLETPEDGQTQTYRFEVVEWPEEGGGSTHTLTAESGSFVVTGTDAELSRSDPVLTAESGSFAWTGTAATLSVSDPVLTAESGQFTVSGTAASFELIVPAESGEFLVTGTDATLDYSGAATFTLLAESGSFAWTGTAAALVAARLLAAASGSFAWTGTAATLSLGDPVLVAESGVFLVFGSVAELRYSAESARGRAHALVRRRRRLDLDAMS